MCSHNDSVINANCRIPGLKNAKAITEGEFLPLLDCQTRSEEVNICASNPRVLLIFEERLKKVRMRAIVYQKALNPVTPHTCFIFSKANTAIRIQVIRYTESQLLSRQNFLKSKHLGFYSKC